MAWNAAARFFGARANRRRLEKVVAFVAPEGAREIPGYPHYFATLEGTIVSAKCPDWRGVAPLVTHLSRGYPALTLRMDGRTISRRVHILVLLAFQGPRPSLYHEARHLDGNPLNSRPDNLAWGTKAENVADRLAHGRPCGWAKLTEQDVRDIRRLWGAGTRQIDLAERYGIGQTTVSAIVTRRSWPNLSDAPEPSNDSNGTDHE